MFVEFQKCAKASQQIQGTQGGGHELTEDPTDQIRPISSQTIVVLQLDVGSFATIPLKQRAESKHSDEHKKILDNVFLIFGESRLSK